MRYQLKVKHKKTNEIIWIKLDRFNPSIHEKIQGETPKPLPEKMLNLDERLEINGSRGVNLVTKVVKDAEARRNQLSLEDLGKKQEVKNNTKVSQEQIGKKMANDVRDNLEEEDERVKILKELTIEGIEAMKYQHLKHIAKKIGWNMTVSGGTHQEIKAWVLEELQKFNHA